jgi:hypothetical protein
MLKHHYRKLVTLTLAFVFSVTLVGCGGSGSGTNPNIAGVTGPTVELVDGRFILSMGFSNVALNGGVTLPIPKYPNSSLSIGPDFASNGMLIVLTIAVQDFVNVNANGLNPQTLPGGRPLPGVAQGALPAIALQVPQLLNSVFYVGPQVLGFFVPFKGLNLAGAILTYRFFDKTGVQVGNISVVGQDQNKQNGGILVLVNIDSRIQTAINAAMAAL